jgi:hypothetical protein
MYDPELLVEKLQTLLEALERIPRRFARTIFQHYSELSKA